MFDKLPNTVQSAHDWTWDDVAPYFNDLQARDLTEATIDQWLLDRTSLEEVLTELVSRARVAVTQDTTDKAVEAHYKRLLEQIVPPVEVARNDLNKKLLASGLTPEGTEVPLRRIRTDAELFREANLDLFTEDRKASMEYAKFTGAQTVTIDGEEKTLLQLAPYYLKSDRDLRERVWRMEMARWLEDRQAINDVWVQLLDLRRQMAANADLPDYRAFRWKQMNRFDYTPEDCFTFHDAIEAVVVPAAQRIYEKRRQRLGVSTLRPWDLNVDPQDRTPLKPFATTDVFKQKTSAVFHQVDPRAGQYFDTMVQEDLLDLENRKGKGPGGYCTAFPRVKRPFIFMNAVGVSRDVTTLLHESGHAFHQFSVNSLRYSLQRHYPIEFAEVASMSMELLAAPYLSGDGDGSFFSAAEAARYRIEHLEKIVLFWPYMAVVDAFQHWAYTHPDDAANPDNCDARWAELWGRFMKGVDWSGFEDSMETGWHRKQHIYGFPFYYVEYGLAQLGAVQVWANALKNQADAVRHYFEGLALGTTVSLPELYAAAGARFAFDEDTLSTAVNLLESTIADLEQMA